MRRSGVIGLACSALLAVAMVGSSLATPLPTRASIESRTFNDCPLSTLTVTNSFPASIEITDEMSNLCVGFANLHSWSFSTDGGANAATFANNSNFRYGADVTLSGAGEGEGGLRLSPWWSGFVDGRFMLNATSGEIACFGGRIPFYSFTAANGVTYTRGTTVRMEITYHANGLSASSPGTIQYRLVSGGVTYDSPVLPFDQANPAEDPPHGLWGILNDARVGGYFQPRANTGAALTANWSHVSYTTLDDPNPNSASVETRTFNDCPLSTLTVSNNYPACVTITDEMSSLCVGFANLHSWSFSEDGGATAAVFSNSTAFRYGADVTLAGGGTGEGGLRISPWFSPFVDGRFMINATSGEIACFGGRLPFYSFTGAQGVLYTKGTTVHMEIVYDPNSLTAADPGTIQYILVSGGTTYSSPVLPFDGANPNEDPPYGVYGILNGARVGGYFQPRANTGSALTASWCNITFSHCLATASVVLNPRTLNTRSHGQFITATITPSGSPSDIDVSSLRLNGTVGATHASIDGGSLVAKFSRADVIGTLGEGNSATLTLTGNLGGDCFTTSDHILLKGSTLAAPAAGASLAAGNVVGVSWPSYADFPFVDVILTGDDGLTWSVVARDVPNTSAYDWTVPGVNTSQARLGVVRILSIDADGIIIRDELSESGTFAITSPLGVGGPSTLQFALRGVTPNPAPGAFKVDFTLPTGKAASIGIFDIAGRQVASREVGSLGAGNHSVEFGRGKTLAAGLYLVRLTQGGRTLTARAIVSW